MDAFNARRLCQFAVKKASCKKAPLGRVLLNQLFKRSLDNYLEKESLERPNRPTTIREMDFMPIISEDEE